MSKETEKIIYVLLGLCGAMVFFVSILASSSVLPKIVIAICIVVLVVAFYGSKIHEDIKQK